MTAIQMFLALGAALLLSLIILTTNTKTLLTEEVMYDSNFGITATSIASSVIEDASKKRFDNIFYVDSTRVYNSSDFTPPASLGVDSGEVDTDPHTFNDFDDYNGYSGVDSTMPSAIFRFSSIVSYVDQDDPDLSFPNQSFHKKITVRVWSESMKDTMVMSSIFSYWSFLP
jgi:MSHA pilin protein MshD